MAHDYVLTFFVCGLLTGCGNGPEVTGDWSSHAIPQRTVGQGATSYVENLSLFPNGNYMRSTQISYLDSKAPSVIYGCTGTTRQAGVWKADVMLATGSNPSFRVLRFFPDSQSQKIYGCPEAQRNRDEREVSSDAPSTFEYELKDQSMILRDFTSQDSALFTRSSF
jgi:hypothetical protein